MSQHARLQHYDYGITCIDTELFRPGLACCYLVQQGDEAAFIDTGTRNSVPPLCLRYCMRLKSMGCH